MARRTLCCRRTRASRCRGARTTGACARCRGIRLRACRRSPPGRRRGHSPYHEHAGRKRRYAKLSRPRGGAHASTQRACSGSGASTLRLAAIIASECAQMRIEDVARASASSRSSSNAHSAAATSSTVCSSWPRDTPTFPATRPLQIADRRTRSSPCCTGRMVTRDRGSRRCGRYALGDSRRRDCEPNKNESTRHKESGREWAFYENEPHDSSHDQPFAPAYREVS